MNMISCLQGKEVSDEISKNNDAEKLDPQKFCKMRRKKTIGPRSHDPTPETLDSK